MKTIKNAPFLMLPLTAIFSLLITACTQNSPDQAERQPADSLQLQEQPSSNDENDSVTETPATNKIQFERERSFGSSDEVILGEMGPIAVGPNGELFLSDNDQSTVHAFQSDGSYIKALGRQGRGPGEFMMIYGYTTMATQGTQLYVTDLAGMGFQFPFRMLAFSMDDLVFNKTMVLLAENKSDFDQLEGHYSKRIFPLDDGRFLVSYHRSPNDYQEQDSFIHYVIQDSAGTIIDGPILMQNDRKQLSTEIKSVYRGRINDYIAITSFPFFGKSILEVSTDDTIYAVNHTEEFKIDVYSIEADLVRTIEHVYNNVPFNEENVVDRYQRTNYKDELGDGAVAKMIEKAEQLPTHWPAIQEMLIDSSNRLWVSTIVEDFDVYEWWVLEESGEVITTFDWPRDESIEVIKNGKMYTRQTDEETGLEQIVRYRVEFEGVE